MKFREWYQNIPKWHAGKLILVWGVGILILVAMILSEREYAGPYGSPKYSDQIGLWLLFSLPVIIITWKWLGKREEQKPERNAG